MAARVMSLVIPRLAPNRSNRAAEQLLLVMLHDAKATTRQAAFVALKANERGPSVKRPFAHLVLEVCVRHEQSLLYGLRSSVRPH
jgi:hypothetical protein